MFLKSGQNAPDSAEYGSSCGHWRVQARAGTPLPRCPECHQVVEYLRVASLPRSQVAVPRRPGGVASAGIDFDLRRRGPLAQHRVSLELMSRSARREGHRLWNSARAHVRHR
jgi:hypothetical protein